MMIRYFIEQLDCANCARKIEDEINRLPDVKSASLNFASGELRIESSEDEAVLQQQIKQILAKIEPDASLKTVAKQNTKALSPSPQGKNHDHGYKDLALLFLLLGTFLYIIALLLGESVFAVLFFGIAGILVGYPTFWKGIKKLRHFRFDENNLLLIAFIASFLIGEYAEGCMVILLFSIGERLESRAVDRSRKKIEALTEIRPETARLLSDGVWKEVRCEEVAIGDHILLTVGDRIPLDCAVVSGASQIDQSAITGESIPRSVCEGEKLLSGSINLTSPLECRVTETFDRSTAARMIEMVKESAAQKGSAETLISRFAAKYTPCVMIIALLFAILPPIFGWMPFSRAVYTALVLLVASCPCAIVISVPLAFFSCIGVASSKGVLIKGGKYVEALAKADQFAFDKTGTVTTGALVVDQVFAFDSALTTLEITEIAAKCEAYSNHPIAKALRPWLPEILPQNKTIEEYTEYSGMGIRATIEGVPYLCGGRRLLEKSGFSVSDLPDAALYLADLQQQKVVGAIRFRDQLRAESKSIFAALKKLGVTHITILSGDREEAVKACADELHSDYRFDLIPEQKVEAVQMMKRSAKATAFVGDGINDAPVLAVSDVGIAMGLGSDSAIEAADAVLVAGNLTALPDALHLSKQTMRIIRFNLIFALVIKLAVFLLAIFGMGQMWMAVFADVGVSVLSVLNVIRLFRNKK